MKELVFDAGVALKLQRGSASPSGTGSSAFHIPKLSLDISKMIVVILASVISIFVVFASTLVKN
jgi:hypothetical protein